VADLVVAPLGLGAPEEVVVVPVGVLQRAPWSALLSCPVSVAPSAATWQESALRPSHPGRPAVLVAGPRLEAAVDEVRALAEVHPGARVLLPPDSTSATVRAALDGAGIAHLACHGAVRADNPLFSSLVLADGPLTVQELEARGAAPHRLVLASCESGADATYAGDEVLGFVSALLARGTAGIVASVAAVPDVAAVDLMCGLHEHLNKGRTLAHALFEARESLDRDDPGAYVSWCTFGAHGAA
jgi:CHAT domain-containing protein